MSEEKKPYSNTYVDDRDIWQKLLKLGIQSNAYWEAEKVSCYY